MLNKLKNISAGLLDTVLLFLVDRGTDKDEDTGNEMARKTGQALDVLCSTESKEKIDQDNARKTKRIRFMRIRRGFNIGSKKVLENWNNKTER